MCIRDSTGAAVPAGSNNLYDGSTNGHKVTIGDKLCVRTGNSAQNWLIYTATDLYDSGKQGLAGDSSVWGHEGTTRTADDRASLLSNTAVTRPPFAYPLLFLSLTPSPLPQPEVGNFYIFFPSSRAKAHYFSTVLTITVCNSVIFAPAV